MKPHEFLIIQHREQAIIDQAQDRINSARAAAEECPTPKRLRPVAPADVTPGAILWHKRSKKDGGPFWCIVDYYSTNIHAHRAAGSYMADDGCLYPIDGAFIEE